MSLEYEGLVYAAVMGGLTTIAASLTGRSRLSDVVERQNKAGRRARGRLPSLARWWSSRLASSRSP